MTKLTRRGALGLTGGALGLAACGGKETPPPVTNNASGDKAAMLEDMITKEPPYKGEVAFEHGVACGDPTAEGFVLWTRVTPKSGDGDIPVVVMMESADEESVMVSLGYATAARDYCVKFYIERQSPATDYTYKFIVRTEDGDVTSSSGRGRTLAESGDAPVKFAVISCSNWQFGQFNVYDAISKQDDLDAVIHLGDYFYEYGVDGYGGSVGIELGRTHEPPIEVVTLGDYRMRHAQYKSDPKLQAAHAAAPWLCTWDDHESANDSYRTGAQNHNPENNEGEWSDRKLAAIQAYMEWMPVREPEPGALESAMWRSFNFGDVATVMCLETRLTGRSEGIDWGVELAGVEATQIPMSAAKVMSKVQDETRTMLGSQQEQWLDEELKVSAARRKSWQVLANQVVMANVKAPNLTATLSEEQKAAQDIELVKLLIDFSQLGMPWNLDAWDGFPAARERLYASAKAAGARLVTLTGDTHTAWGNTLQDAGGERRGVEFGCTSVTSPGIATYIKDVPELGRLFEEANDEVDFHDPYGHGYTQVTLTKDTVKADFIKVSNIMSGDYSVSTADTFEAKHDGEGMTGLQRT